MVKDKTELKHKFGKKLKELRKAKGLTQEEIAEKAEISAQSVSGFETGSSFPNYTNLNAIIQKLDIPALHLFLFPEDIAEYKKDELIMLLTELLEGLSYEDKISVVNFARFLKNKEN